jgi:phosphoenolpyruvate carboxykinase (GTP)
MKNQFDVYNHPKLTEVARPILAGLNYFLTHASRGGSSPKLLGEKRDVKVWLTWLSKFAHKEIEALDTPIGFIPKYKDLKDLFTSIISKEYPKELYDKQFSIYIEKIQSRIDLQREAFGKEENLPKQLFKVYDEWSEGLKKLKDKFGAIVTPDKLA